MKVERHQIKGTPEIIRLCSLSKELYNACNYEMRKAYYGKQSLPDINGLVIITKELDCCKQLHNTKTAKQTIRQVLTDWSNFKKATNAYYKDKSKFIRKPKPPYYKNKLAPVIFYNETIKRKPLKSGIITPTNGCFSVNSNKPFKQVVIIPKTFGFTIEVQYEINKQIKPKRDRTKVCCIDIGVNNLCAITSNQHKPILVNGRIVKSINQWYNKNQSKTASKKRYWRLENYFHHVSKMIITNCQKYDIGKIIIGKNDGWKQNINLGRRNNQTFCSIPFYKLMQKIQYKADDAGIVVEFTEEAYTSKASFLDKDDIPAYEKGKESPIFSGKRINRGMYRSSGKPIHADVNGSLNIGRKVIGNKIYEIFPNRSIAAMPVIINPLSFFYV